MLGTYLARLFGLSKDSLSFLLLASLALGGCSIRADIGLEDKSAVQTPIYSANKVLFATSYKVNEVPDGRYAHLLEGYEAAAQANDKGTTRRSIRNRDPISIIVSRAFVPPADDRCSRRSTDWLRGKARDIAVLLDVSTSSDREEFIAVWYQRDVPPGETLNFQDLLVYSSDSWDAKYPPYFRLRLMDVTSERNTETGALLDRVRSSSSTIAGLVGVPDAAPLLGLASLAARQVLAHERNRSLVDFTFQLYNAGLLGESGGVPLGVLQTGGMLVTSAPCGESYGYWDKSYRYDYRRQRIQETETRVDQAVPFIFATILTADLSVPQIVRARSAAIMKRLTDPKVVQNDLLAAQADANSLSKALDALKVRETFRRRPSKDSFATMVAQLKGSFTGLDDAEKGFFLDALYQITGVNLPKPEDYLDWYNRCGTKAVFDEQTARFERQVDATDESGNKCWA